MDKSVRRVRIGVEIFNNGVGSVETLVPLQTMTREAIGRVAEKLSNVHFDGGVEPLPEAIAAGARKLPGDGVNVLVVLSDNEAYVESGPERVESALAAARARGIRVLFKQVKPANVSLEAAEAAILEVLNAPPEHLAQLAVGGNRLAYQLLKSKSSREAALGPELIRLFFDPAMRAKPQLRALLFAQGTETVQQLFTAHTAEIMQLARAGDQSAIDVVTFLGHRTPSWMVSQALAQIPEIIASKEFTRVDRVLLAVLAHHAKPSLVEALGRQVVPLLRACAQDRPGALYCVRLCARDLVGPLARAAIDNREALVRAEAKALLMAVPEGRARLGAERARHLGTQASISVREVESLLRYDHPDRLLQDFLEHYVPTDLARARALVYLASWGDREATTQLTQWLSRTPSFADTVASFAQGDLVLRRILYAEADRALSLQLGLRLARKHDTTAFYYVMMRYPTLRATERAEVHAQLGAPEALRSRMGALASFAADADMRREAARWLIAERDPQAADGGANNAGRLVGDPQFAPWFDALFAQEEYRAAYTQLADRLQLEREQDPSKDAIEHQLWIWRARFLAGEAAAQAVLIQQLRGARSAEELSTRVANLQLTDATQIRFFLQVAAYHAQTEVEYALAVGAQVLLGDATARDRLQQLAKGSADKGIQLYCQQLLRPR